MNFHYSDRRALPVSERRTGRIRGAGHGQPDRHVAALRQCCCVCVCACACVLLPLTLSSFPLQMTDVQAGGATVFTDIGAAVKPKKVQLLTFFIIIIITETSLFNKPN